MLAAGGALSHHHGAGLNRARFVREALGEGFEVFAAVKQALETLRRERHGDRVPGWRETVTELEWFLGYPEFAARVMKYGGG